jgi:hypothetical protein
LLAQTDRQTRDSAWRSQRLFARESLFAPPGNQRIPENCAAYGDADKPRHLRGDSEPLSHFALVLAVAENDTSDMIAAAAACRRYESFAVLAPIQAFNLPQIWFDAGVLKLLDRFDHQTGPQLAIVGRFIAV